jgi:hypothetical protein
MGPPESKKRIFLMQSNYENFPLWIIALTNALSILVYAIGIFILSQLGIIFAAFYFLFCIVFEIRLLRRSCVNCYYYGKLCGFGKGRICSFFFSQGDPKKFGEHPLTWKELLPDMLILFFPLLGGIIALIINFNWIILGAIIVILFLSFMGNAFIRGSFSCKYCKQREVACPAIEFFSHTNAGHT